MGKISSKLVRNIKGDGSDVAFLQASHSMNYGRSPSSFDLGIQESTEFSGEDQAEEPLEKVNTGLHWHPLDVKTHRPFAVPESKPLQN